MLVFNASFEKSSNMTVPLKAIRSFRSNLAPQVMYYSIPKLPIPPPGHTPCIGLEFCSMTQTEVCPVGHLTLCQNSGQSRQQKCLVNSFCIRDSKVIASILTALLGYLRTFKKGLLNVSVLEWKMLLKWQNPLKTVFRDLNILVVIRRIFTFEWKVWSLRKFLNSH